MSEYTNIYLHMKGAPVLSFRNYPTPAEEQSLSQEQIRSSCAEVDTYNEINVPKSYGCVLFYLGTTPTRQLDVLPYSDEPRPLSKELLDDILSFYQEEIQSLNNQISEFTSQVDILEKRILMANPEIYDRISQDIDANKGYIKESMSALAYLKGLYCKFEFVKNIIIDPDNTDYELLYTKCWIIKP